MKKIDLTLFLEELYPEENAENWDVVGYQYGKETDKLNGVVVGLDCSIKLINFAIEKKANLIITHHPITWPNYLKSLESDYTLQIYKLLDKHKITVYSLHTNLDNSDNGVHDWISEMLEWKDFKRIENSKTIRYVDLPKPISIQELTDLLKDKLKVSSIKANNSEKLISRIVIIPGSGASLIEQIKSTDADALITGDIKWNYFVQAHDWNIVLIDVGHEIEEIVVDKLYQIIHQKFPNLPLYFLKDKDNIIKYF
ncbi:Nif3-like dinuclear metal center hexameric protein [Mycoplasma sp. SG1]|uniref:Nif3-like dinuclear metal center hexameric protein n=1 Tax=Mycoplasma sp. SG1 TaxID=2810348 RepID=UPI002023EAE9|nr:Nif3-like dinuclear metal center hexameric protein [Mycoplasma sp. SG1]URM53046.1 Nif3-like dinuclear metal center hexameric protein [Mycoplasma sp. SG1]